MSTERAVVAAVAAAIEDEDEGEQLDLLAVDAAESDGARTKIEQLRRGPGRPEGARNKRTERTVRWLLARHKDPREVLLAIADMHPLDLARMLDCKPIDAVAEIRMCATAVMPFIAQRQPLAIDVSTKSLVYLTINKGGQAEPGQGVGLAAKVLELQPLSEDAADDVGQAAVGREGKDDDAATG